MKRRHFLTAIPGVALGPLLATSSWGETTVDDLPQLEGELSLYLGRGEGGLYENVLAAIQKRNPGFELSIRRGPTAALANAIVAEHQAGIRRADVFWAVDAGALGLIAARGIAAPLPPELTSILRPRFRYADWLPITGRIRTLPYFSDRVSEDDVPDDIMALPESGLSVGWAPTYAAFQSFVTGMRLLEGEQATLDWLRRMAPNARKYAGELGVVMAVERGEVDVGLANHYYTLRLRAGKPAARVAIALTDDDAGCLLNASGMASLSGDPLSFAFMRYLLTKEVQSYLAREAFEIPLAEGVAPPEGLAMVDSIQPPELDLTQLADLRPTLDLMRRARVL